MVSTEYINGQTKLIYICPKHGLKSITYANLRSGHGCPDCGHAKIGAKRRLTYEYVSKVFKDAHMTLLENEYFNNAVLMKYRCNICGYEGKIAFNHLCRGTGCAKCARRYVADQQRHPFEFVKSEFEKSNLRLLSKSYKQALIPLKYECKSCGHIGYIQYSQIQQGHGCPRCSSSKGEKTVAQWLTENHMVYASQYTYSDLHSKKGGILRFDFAIFKSDGKTLVTLLEYNGEQHYFPVDFCGKGAEHAQQQFIEGQARDQLKVDYCKSHDIPLLIIKYDEDITQVLHDNLL